MAEVELDGCLRSRKLPFIQLRLNRLERLLAFSRQSSGPHSLTHTHKVDPGLDANVFRHEPEKRDIISGILNVICLT